MKIILLSALFILGFMACGESDPDPIDVETNLPEKFSVGIPSSISAETTAKSLVIDENIDGDDVYEHMRLFIRLGEESAELVEAIIQSLRTQYINQAMTYSYTSGDDGREKNVEVLEDVTYNGKTYDLFLTLTDEDNEIGLQVIWNNSPVEGIAVINPYNMNRLEDEKFMDVMYQVEYSEVAYEGYEAHMIVSISDWPYPISDVYGLDNLKMFVGKKGDLVEVFGNSNHPNATFLNPANVGYNWAFAARGDNTQNIAVANVALPLSTVDTNVGLFENYALRDVLVDELIWWAAIQYPNFTQSQIEAFIEANYLQEAKAPAYFDNGGYISSGTNVPEGWNIDFINLDGFTPYVPSEIAALQLSYIVIE